VDIEKLSRWQAMDLASDITHALKAEHYGTACQLAGMTEELVDDLTFEELGQVLNVRLTAILARAGIKIGGE
jgi:hypothetical protein